MKDKMIHIGSTLVRKDAIIGFTYRLRDPKDNYGVELGNYYEIFLMGISGSISVTGSYDELKPEVDLFIKELEAVD